MRLEKFKNDDLLLEGINDRGVFKALFLAGIAGSGKSYVSSKVKSGGIEPRIVNTDTWIEYFGNSYEMWYDVSKKLVRSQLALYVNAMLPLICDQTSTSINTVLRRHSILERMGYDTAMIYVNTSLETAIDRASKRERKVPEWQVKEYYERMKKIKPYLKTRFPLYLEIKNDTGELTDEVILAAFKRVLFFFDSPIQNPLGVDAYNMMVKNGWKELSPNIYSMSDIKSIVKDWYSF